MTHQYGWSGTPVILRTICYKSDQYCIC